jgi:hypothetical protein
MIETDRCDVLLAIALLRDVREDFVARKMLRAFTDSKLIISGADVLPIAQYRLKQPNPKYPLLDLHYEDELKDELLHALASTTTLTSLTLSAQKKEVAARVALQLKALLSVRSVQLDVFPIEQALDLLHSRTNWTWIGLPQNAEGKSRASSFASLNQTDFELCMEQPDANLKPWLCNPHLTALTSRSAPMPESCYEALERCQNLTYLVWCSVLALPWFSCSRV